MNLLPSLARQIPLHNFGHGLLSQDAAPPANPLDDPHMSCSHHVPISHDLGFQVLGNDAEDLHSKPGDWNAPTIRVDHRLPSVDMLNNF